MKSDITSIPLLSQVYLKSKFFQTAKWRPFLPAAISLERLFQVGQRNRKYEAAFMAEQAMELSEAKIQNFLRA